MTYKSIRATHDGQRTRRTYKTWESLEDAKKYARRYAKSSGKSEFLYCSIQNAEGHEVFKITAEGQEIVGQVACKRSSQTIKTYVVKFQRSNGTVGEDKFEGLNRLEAIDAFDACYRHDTYLILDVHEEPEPPADEPQPQKSEKAEKHYSRPAVKQTVSEEGQVQASTDPEPMTVEYVSYGESTEPGLVRYRTPEGKILFSVDAGDWEPFRCAGSNIRMEKPEEKNPCFLQVFYNSRGKARYGSFPAHATCYRPADMERENKQRGFSVYNPTGTEEKVSSGKWEVWLNFSNLDWAWEYAHDILLFYENIHTVCIKDEKTGNVLFSARGKGFAQEPEPIAARRRTKRVYDTALQIAEANEPYNATVEGKNAVAEADEECDRIQFAIDEARADLMDCAGDGDSTPDELHARVEKIARLNRQLKGAEYLAEKERQFWGGRLEAVS